MSLLKSINKSSDIKDLNLEQLPELAREVRQLILDTVLKNGGHLASSLGVVEVILAMHYVFNPPNDRFIFDVGHQAYAHKIITGRRDNFDTLRTLNGIAGFPKREESKYDTVNTGHSSTAIAIGTGLAKASELSGLNHNIVSLVGDGAMTGGLSYEALNYASQASGKQIIILNDNKMSIGKNVGQVANYLMKLHSSNRYIKAKKRIKAIFAELKLSESEQSDHFLSKVKNSIKYFLHNGMPFEQYGFNYFGPIDGHDFNSLISAMQTAASSNENTILHVVTVKGKGYKKAEENPAKYHGYSGAQANVKDVSRKLSFSDAFGQHLVKLAEKHDRIVAITAAMTEGTGLAEFAKRYPKRFVDVGIAEAQATALACGLAIEGYKPYFAVYSSFLQRAYDQIIHDICMQKLPVTLCIDRAGIVPADGETHQGIYDVSALRAIPNMSIICPKDSLELEAMLDFSLAFNAPLAIRYPKGTYNNIVIDTPKNSQQDAISSDFNPFKYEVLKNGVDVTILACGALMVREAMTVFKNSKISATVINARSIKPLDYDMLKQLKGDVVVLEDNQTSGGFGSAVLEFYTKVEKKGVNVHIFAIEDDTLTHATVEELLVRTKLDAKNIESRIDKILKK